MAQEIWENFPIISFYDKYGAEYRLREQRSDDAEAFFNYYNDERVNRYILSIPPANLDEALSEINYWNSFFCTQSGIYWAIVSASDDQMIGSIGLTSWCRSHMRIELSYDLAINYWNKGIMKTAIKLVTQVSFDGIGINRIEAFAVSENIHSGNAMKSCGYQKEGLLRQHRYHRGIYWDVEIYAITRRDYLLRNV